MASGRLYPVILSGGSGSRLWPLSREDNPKQLQALVTDKTLLQDTALRLSGGAPKTEAPIIVCNEVQRFIVAEQLRQVEIEPKAVVIEPMGRNTAPAVAVAALVLKDEPDALMLVMPSDHLIRRPDAFRVAVESALPAARAGRFVTFGITPTGPSTAYGYIKRGSALQGSDGFAVERFVEKPDAKTAASYVASGDYFWNAGIFLFSARAYLDELAKHEPAIGPACAAALETGKTDLFFFRLDADAFAKSPSQSIDYGVMERTDKAAVVPVDMGWSDVGSWSALHAENAQDEDGNTLLGDVVAIGAESSYVRSEKQLTTVLGVKNLAVVVTPDAVLVADKSRDQDVKAIVDKLKKAQRTEATQAAITYRPWGWFQTIDEGHRFKVKRIVVKPGAKLSLQKHWHRSEHWVVVTGTAIVTRDKDDFLLRENESTFIPAGTVHRLANPGHVDLHMIEVQSGEYVGEDDIVRLVDDYGRSGGEGAGGGRARTPSRKAKAKGKAAAKKAPKSSKTRRKAGAVPAKRRSARRGTRRQR
ncbi:MAG: mannose-1-phosphate guanylyltransferase/mannose-6-phosphate isomerase [Rhodobacteraceae bacterium]|nr:mannose-1-phosphate guanylyltransferase/mannose-6-phosphate isomerase [Paracoccaceae bacterium]